MIPNLCLFPSRVDIPLDSIPDSKVWIHSTSRDLTLKDAYNFKFDISSYFSWSKHIWNLDIPHSKAFIVWILFHNRMPTNENLRLRGCHLPSMCSLCKCHKELLNHFFFYCSYALHI